MLVFTACITRLGGLVIKNGVSDWAAAIRVGLAVMFCFTGIAHFNHLRPDLISMVPPWIPYPDHMVSITGVCEIGGGLLLFHPGIRFYVAIALIMLLLAMLPANVYAALSNATIAGKAVTPLWPRVAIQAVFVASVWYGGILKRLPADHA